MSVTHSPGGDNLGTVDLLLPKHRADLHGSGLSESQIARCGFYSETDRQNVVELLGNYLSAKTAAKLVPCLCIPFFGPEGKPLNYVRLKPDNPRSQNNGKQIKYESPAGKPSRAFFPPATRAVLADPGIPLLVTEGEKKAAKADQEGFACIGLVGVYGWMVKRAEGQDGKKSGPRTLISDLAAVVWSKRQVTIVFDSDIVVKPEVRLAEWHLAEVLQAAGADVRVVRLPAESNGNKNGLDDYLYRYSPDSFRQLLEAAAPATNPEETPAGCNRYTDSGYTVINGLTYHCVLVRDTDSGELKAEKQTKLANFSAQIISETINDDGAEQTREFGVSAVQRNRPPVCVNVPVERFNSLDWIVERFGPRYVIQAGNGKRDHLRCAIQEMSGDDIPSTTIYRHTGWREIGGQWCYLHAGGAISPTGPGPQIEVRLDGAADGFRLPPPPTGEELRTAVRASLGILNGLAPDLIAFPLLATVYRAALGSSDYTLWLAGQTGAQKSELAALGQQHFGAGMTRSRLPGNWSSTENALEGLAFVLKDALLVIDDFAPSTSRNDADRQHRSAERLIRGQGNHSGRQRMRADGTLRPPKPPRGLILATGEDIPRIHSITARLSVLDVQRGNVNLTRLSECQRDAADGLYASAMAGFLSNLAPQYAAVQSGLEQERIELRNRFVGKYPHARTPDIIANLLIGLRYLLAFAQSVGAIDRTEREKLWERGEVAFRAAADLQGEHQRATDPVARFPEMVATIISSGRGHIAGKDGGEPGIPPSSEAWGWEGREFRSGAEDTSVSYRGRGSKIGWAVGDELYLDPDATYAALADLAREQGQAYPLNQNTLYRRLKEAGLLRRTDKDRTSYPETLEGIRRRVLVLPASLLLGNLGQPGQPGQTPANEAETVPVFCPSFSTHDPKPGQETGTNPPENPASVPVVPVVPVSEGDRRAGKSRRQYRNDDRPHVGRG